MADGVSVEGVDYAFSRPSIPGLAAAGKVFACRYGGPGTSGKHLTPAEAQTLNANGISVVANAEGAANGLAGGWDVGVSWATSAEAHFRRCGMPSGRPIYLSVDFDVTSSTWPACAQALRGAASVLGASRVGVYGGRKAIEWARRDGVAQWFWQTYAWSQGIWVAGNHLEQYRNGVDLAGGSVDLNRALKTDYGQWSVGGIGMLTQEDLKQIATAAWQLYLAPGGYNMQDHALNTENHSVKAAQNTELLRVELAALRKAIQDMAGGSAETAAILAGVNRMLDEQLPQIEQAVDRQLDQAFTGGADKDTTPGV